MGFDDIPFLIIVKLEFHIKDHSLAQRSLEVLKIDFQPHHTYISIALIDLAVVETSL
jgi:hypothetical protein